jgi:ferrous iron transport protein B
MHSGTEEIPKNSIALFGHSNVGKSLIFQKLTGKKVIVSNYPGTTVEITSGSIAENPHITLLDTPGVSTWPAQSEDEQLSTRVLLEEPLAGLIQVGDAKHLGLVLSHAVMLIEMGLPMVLALNMMDEAKNLGLEIDIEALKKELSIGVIPTTAVKEEGVQALYPTLQNTSPSTFVLQYSDEIEEGLKKITPYLPKSHISSRALGLMCLSRDEVFGAWLASQFGGEKITKLNAVRDSIDTSSSKSIVTQIQITRINFSDQLTSSVTSYSKEKHETLLAKIGKLSTHPMWGMPILLLALYFVYWFVGVFGAQTLVGFLEVDLFSRLLTPIVSKFIHQSIPIPFIQELLVGEYGIWTMGFTYAIALILPIITTFFFAFGLIEDSGYLPRLAILSNGLFKKIGLNGKAILPMVLGLGCVTMATLTTRTLESKRDRLLVILLLALAVPCSAQLGIILGLLAGVSASASIIWAVFIVAILFIVGKLANYLLPGERSGLIIELPLMRAPVLSNVLQKTKARLEWYLKEVFPIFIFGAVLMFTLDKIGLMAWLIEAGKPITVNWLGLPAETSAAFVLGFLRRDFGATGLFAMNAQGLLSPHQIVVAMVTITLFIPCIATVLIIAKERGWKVATAMVFFVIPFAFFVGGLLNHGLTLFNF